MLTLVALLSVLIGATLGMLGGGGAILMLPMLVYLAHIDAKVAIATSLFVVGSTSLVGTAIHARAGNVRWKIGGVFSGAAMLGAFAGGRLAHLIPATVLLVVFGVVMLVSATAMLRGRSGGSGGRLAVGHAIALGGAVGVLSGLVGAGGGFLIVPALALFGGLAMPEAIATSLFVITLQSFAGFAGHAAHVDLNWPLMAIASGGAIVGSVLGAFVGRRLPANVLRRAFGYLVVAMGLFVIAKEVPTVVAVVVAVVTLIAVYLVTRNKPRERLA